jgi:uncharacterized membrane-anchored protein
MIKWKFEYVLAVAVVAILAGALVGAFMTGNKDLINMLVVAFVGGLGSVMAYFFKHNPTDKGSGGNG